MMKLTSSDAPDECVGTLYAPGPMSRVALDRMGTFGVLWTIDASCSVRWTLETWTTLTMESTDRPTEERRLARETMAEQRKLELLTDASMENCSDVTDARC